MLFQRTSAYVSIRQHTSAYISIRRLARPVGEVEVALDGGALPLPPQRVLDLEVDLRTVERSVALVDRVLPALAVEGLYETVGSDAFQFTA